MLPPEARTQYIGRFHTRADKRASEQKLLADSAAIKEFVEVKRMCNHQKKVVVARRKIKCPTHLALPVAATTRPSAVADTGCSASGIISPADSIALGLPNLGPSAMRIRDANGGTTNAMQETLIQKNEVSGGVGRAIVGPVERSLEGIGQYADEGFVIVYHDAYNGVSVHRKEDVIINWSRASVQTGWRSPTNKSWH